MRRSRHQQMNMPEWRRQNTVSKNALIGGKGKQVWETTRSEIGLAGITTRPCHCSQVGSSTSKLGGRKKKTPAITFNQVRVVIASIIRVTYECDSPRVVMARVTKRLQRNQLAKLYHWRKHKRLPPRNLERRR